MNPDTTPAPAPHYTQELDQVMLSAQQQLEERFQASQIQNLHHLHLFLEPYGFVVWELVALMQQLHQQLTNASAADAAHQEARKLADKMMLVAGSDINLTGRNTDLLAVYRKGMDACGANSQHLNTFEARLRRGELVRNILRNVGAGPGVTQHTDNTARLLQQKDKPHLLAAVLCLAPRLPHFQPLMTRLDELDKQFPLALVRIRYYFEVEEMLTRQLLVPLGRRMLQLLCGTDQAKWEDSFGLIKTATLSRAAVLSDAEELIRNSRD